MVNNEFSLFRRRNVTRRIKMVTPKREGLFPDMHAPDTPGSIHQFLEINQKTHLFMEDARVFI